jgi:hypothetical protein
MTTVELTIVALLAFMIVSLTPAILIHARPRLEVLYPVRGRWLPPLLWSSVLICFVWILVLASTQP